MHLTAKTHRAAEIISVAYIGLPLILFAIGWLRFWYMCIVLIFASTLLLFFLKQGSGKLDPPHAFVRPRKLIIISLICLTWCIVSGVANITPQTADYIKHNAVFSDLVNKPWPVSYNTEAGSTPLVYYTAYYLPSAAIGKLTSSYAIGNIVLLLWSFVGLLLVFYWILRLVPRYLFISVVIFIFFSGLDVLGHVLLRASSSAYSFPSVGYFEWYTYVGNLQMSSHATSLAWVPQHAIVGWIMSGMLLSAYIEKRYRYPVFSLAVLGLLWSPLVVFGLAPIAVLILGKRIRDGFKISPLQSILCFSSVATLGILLLYYSAGNTSSPAGTFLSFNNPPLSTTYQIVLLLVFMLLEFGILFILLRRSLRHSADRLWLHALFASVFFLVIISLFRYGLFNDLTMRASIPGLFVLCMLTLKVLQDQIAISRTKNYSGTFIILAVYLSLGSITALNELNGHFRDRTIDTMAWQSIGNNNLAESQKIYTRQYLGSKSAYFFTHLAK